MQSFSSFHSPRLYCEQERQFLLTSIDRSLFLVWSGYLGLNSPFTYSISFVSIKSSNHKFHRHFIVLCQPLRHKRLKPAVKAKISLLVTLSWRSAHSGWPHFTWETLELCLCFLDTCWHTHGRTISPKTNKIPVRTIFNRVSIVIRDSTGFGLQGSMIDPENSRHLLDKSDSKLTATLSFAFTRAWGSLIVTWICSGFSLVPCNIFRICHYINDGAKF